MRAGIGRTHSTHQAGHVAHVHNEACCPPLREDLVACFLTTARPCSPDGFTEQGSNNLGAGQWQVGQKSLGELH